MFGGEGDGKKLSGGELVTSIFSNTPIEVGIINNYR